MRDPIVNQKGDTRVGKKMVRLPRCGVGGHNDGWIRIKGSGGEIGIGHQRDMGSEVVTCCQMKLIRISDKFTLDKKNAEVWCY